MPHWVYILESERNRKYYIGFTGGVEGRLRAHNQGRVKATKHLRPWKVVYTEQYEDAIDARKREWYLKSLKSRRVLQTLIDRGPLAQAVRAQS